MTSKAMKATPSQNEKLQALFQKAAYHGWDDIPAYDKNLNQFYVSDNDGGYIVPSVIEIILNHDFAKALFGEETLELYWDDDKKHEALGGTLSYSYDEGGAIKLEVKRYLYHLQQAVISDDPIGYMYNEVFKK